MAHPLVEQLRFSREEWQRGLAGLTEEEGSRCFEPMNSISWMVGHLAAQEQFYWLIAPQGRTVAPEVIACASGKPPHNPSLAAMWAGWEQITQAADPYLDTLTDDLLQTHLEVHGKRQAESLGTRLYRNIYHYWFHLGEGMAVRQLLGHKDLPQFVGDMSRATYRPDRGA